MIYELIINSEDLFNECILQISADFQALRTTSPSADVAYEDFAMFKSDHQLFLSQLRSEADRFYSTHTGAIKNYIVDDEYVAVVLSLKRELLPNGIAFMLKDLFKMGILRGWYQGRNERYYDLYSMQYEVALSKIDSMTASYIITRPYNYI